MATVKQFNPSSLNLPFSILREDPHDYSHTSSKVNSLKNDYDLLRSKSPDDAQPFYKSLDNERERSFWLSNHYSGDWFDHLSNFTYRRLNQIKSMFSNALYRRARVREDL